jgi:hypothetical protein
MTAAAAGKSASRKQGQGQGAGSGAKAGQGAGYSNNVWVASVLRAQLLCVKAGPEDTRQQQPLEPRQLQLQVQSASRRMCRTAHVLVWIGGGWGRGTLASIEARLQPHPCAAPAPCPCLSQPCPPLRTPLKNTMTLILLRGVPQVSPGTLLASTPGQCRCPPPPSPLTPASRFSHKPPFSPPPPPRA